MIIIYEQLTNLRFQTSKLVLLFCQQKSLFQVFRPDLITAKFMF